MTATPKRWIAENDDGTIWSFRASADESCDWPMLNKSQEGPWRAFRTDNRYWIFSDPRDAAPWVLGLPPRDKPT